MKSSAADPQYGNWVPEKLLILLWALSTFSIVVLVVNLLWFKNPILTVVFAIAGAILLVYAILMQMLHHTFSFKGGKLMGQIHQFVLKNLAWDGKGKLLDIGCGSGALTIRCAKAFPQGEMVGADYWGATWDYAQEQCIRNAQLEHISNIQFVKDDAAHLSFPTETFDAAVSNFVFHEVRTVTDKRSLVLEALRVVKKGGSFAFHDMFEVKRLYGDMDQFVQVLKDSGISQVSYIPHTENLPFVPRSIKILFKDTGLLYGIK